MSSKSHLNSVSSQLTSSSLGSVKSADPFTLSAPWLQASPCGLWEPLLDLAAPMDVKAGEIILNPGDPVEGLYLLRRGWVKVTAQTRFGFKRTLLAIGAENTIGEMALFTGKCQQNIIKAITGCQIYYFEQKLVLEAIMANPALVVWLLNNLALKVEIVQSQLQETTFYNLSARVGRFIYLYALDHGETDNLGGRWATISHAELAERLGAHRVTVTNAIRNFKRLGLLRTRPNRIIVPDMEAFKGYLADIL